MYVTVIAKLRHCHVPVAGLNNCPFSKMENP